jgi:hypothetical protein
VGAPGLLLEVSLTYLWKPLAYLWEPPPAYLREFPAIMCDHMAYLSEIPLAYLWEPWAPGLPKGAPAYLWEPQPTCGSTCSTCGRS